MYEEFRLDEELLAITDRIQLFNGQLKQIRTPNKNEPIVDNDDIFFLEHPKQPSKNLANFFLDIEVNFKLNFYEIFK